MRLPGLPQMDPYLEARRYAASGMPSPYAGTITWVIKLQVYIMYIFPSPSPPYYVGDNFKTFWVGKLFK